MIPFSDSVNNNGIVEQTRDFMRVDASQWSVTKICNSCNNWLDTLTGYAIKSDRRFQWDNTQHSKMPIGITPITTSSDYSFLVDEQGNAIITLTRVEYIDITGNSTKLTELDETEEPQALSQVVVTGFPTSYYKLADNIIRLNAIPTAGSLRFYFQRTSPYFVATDTSKTTGFSPLLDRGFIIASAYDGALTLGLQTMQGLSLELQKENQKMITYFSDRNEDVRKQMRPRVENNK